MAISITPEGNEMSAPLPDKSRPEPSILTSDCDGCGLFADLYSRRGFLYCQNCRDAWDKEHSPASSSGEYPTQLWPGISALPGHNIFYNHFMR